MEGRIFNLPNSLSFLRIILIPWFLYYFHTGHIKTAIVIMVVALLTDWFDGQAARWTNDVSEMGKILDPLADKLCLASVAIYFFWIGQLPLWFVFFCPEVRISGVYRIFKIICILKIKRYVGSNATPLERSL